MANGTMFGEDTTCRKTGHNCPTFYYEYHDGIKATLRSINKLHQHNAPKYGEFVHMTGTITFLSDELSTFNRFYKFLISGPGKCFLFILIFACISIMSNKTKTFPTRKQ